MWPIFCHIQPIYPFFKCKFLGVLNNILSRASSTGKLPAKLVEGVITLVAKRPPYDRIENYRPISLKILMSRSLLKSSVID